MGRKKKKSFPRFLVISVERRLGEAARRMLPLRVSWAGGRQVTSRLPPGTLLEGPSSHLRGFGEQVRLKLSPSHNKEGPSIPLPQPSGRLTPAASPAPDENARNSHHFLRRARQPSAQHKAVPSAAPFPGSSQWTGPHVRPGTDPRSCVLGEGAECHGCSLRGFFETFDAIYILSRNPCICGFYKSYPGWYF